MSQPNNVAELRDEIETALNEARILILGGQVIVGVQLRIFFEGDFQQTPIACQRVLFLGLAALLLGLAFLMAPASYHTIVERHHDTVHLLRFTTAMLAIGLLPFAISLGTTMFVSLNKLGTEPMGIAAGIGSFGVCVLCWYAWPLLVRWRRHDRPVLRELWVPTREESMDKLEDKSSQETVTRKVKEVLLEARMVLPGAQALLGFQFINIWLTGFDRMPQTMKLAHLASLCAVAVSTILLMMPAAYHRLAEMGEDTERLVHIAGRLLLTAMVFLAIGVCGDLLVIAVKVELPMAVSIALSVAMFAVFLGLWFGYTLWKRGRRG